MKRTSKEIMDLLDKDFSEQGEVNKSRMYLVKELMDIVRNAKVSTVTPGLGKA